MSFLSLLFPSQKQEAPEITPELKPVCSIPYVSFTRAFQIFQNKLYSIEDNVPIDDEDIQILANAYEDASSPICDHLNDKEWTKIDFHSLLLNENGCISFLKYTHTVKEVGDEAWASLLISDLKINTDNAFHFFPHVGISGRCEMMDNEYKFIPIECFCLIDKNGKNEYAVAQDEDEFLAMMTYASQALLQIMSSQKLDHLKNQKLLSERNIVRAEFTSLKLRDRNLDTLLQDVEDYKSSRKPESTYATGPVI